MSGQEMTTIVLNALPNELGNFVSSIYGKKETTPFNDLRSLCKIEETRLKEKNDVRSSEQTQAYAAMARKKGMSRKKFQKKIDMSKILCYESMNMGISKVIVLNSRRKIVKIGK